MIALPTVQANGVKFAYLEEGAGPLVLLLHGFPDTAHTWDAVRPALAKAGYRAVSPFMRGYFPSEVPADGRYDGDTLGRDVLALIDALGEKSAIVVGHDWGAGAAYSAASMGPPKVRFLATVAIPHPAVMKPSLRIIWGGRHFITLRLRGAEAKMHANDFAHVDELVKRWSPAWNVPDNETRAVKQAFQEPGCLNAALGYYRAVNVRPPPSHLKVIDVPTVAFAAADDGVLVTADYERARKWFSGRYDVVVLPGGHFLHREHPQRFIEELLRVLPREGRG